MANFNEEMKKLKSTDFEDLPLLINEIETKAGSLNFKNKLSGGNCSEHYIAPSRDELNGCVKVKQIDDSEIDAIASRLRGGSHRPPNNINPDLRLYIKNIKEEDYQ